MNTRLKSKRLRRIVSTELRKDEFKLIKRHSLEHHLLRSEFVRGLIRVGLNVYLTREIDIEGQGKF